MRRRSPTYSSPPRRGRGRSRSRSRSPVPRGRYPPRREPPREPATSLLVRNLPKSCRAEDLRGPFKRFGPLRDIYLPRDFYTGEPRGFGFVQYLDPLDAEEAQYHMNRQLLYGRELTVIFAEENRKKPVEMRNKERMRGRGSSVDNGGSYYSHRGRSRTRSRSSRTPLRGHRYSRSPSYEERRARDLSPPESLGRAPSFDRHQHRSRRYEGGRSGSESRSYGGEQSRSASPVSSSGRHSQKGNKHGSYSDAQRLGGEPSHSSPYVRPESPPRHSGKSRRKSPSPSEGDSPERYSRSPPRSPPLQRGHSFRYSNSRSRSPPENQSRDGSEDGGASPERSSMDD